MADIHLLEAEREAQQGTVEVAMASARSDATAIRVRGWYLAAMAHPLWKRYQEQAKEDRGYYVGGDAQWVKDGSEEALRQLKADGRAVISINHINGAIKIITGFEIQNRPDIKTLPQGEEDEVDAQTMSAVLKFYQDQLEVAEYISDAFKEGVIEGMSCLYCGIDWTTDPVDGEIELRKLTPGVDVVWDATWRRNGRYDLRDARYVIDYRRAYVDDVIAQFPDHAATIEEAAARLTLDAKERIPTMSQDAGPSDDYGSSGAPLPPAPDPQTEYEMFDPRDRSILVCHAWYPVYETVYLVANRHTGEITIYESGKAARLIADADTTNLRMIRREQRRIRRAIVLPAALITLEEEETPFENDTDQYPYVPYIAEMVGHEVYGIVRNLKDPQRVENKRISRAMDIVDKFAKLRRVYREGSVADEGSLKDPQAETPIVMNKSAQPGDLGWDTPIGLGEIVRMLVELSATMKLNIREISVVHQELQGQARSTDQSGIAIARLQAQGQTAATGYFSNLRRTRKLFAERFARRIQQTMTREMTLRLTNQDTGEPMLVTVNAPDTRGVTDPAAYKRIRDLRANDPGKPRILRRPDMLKFDVVIAESPATPSARMATLLALMELINKAPAIGPAFIDFLVELIPDLPRRHEMIQRARKLIPPELRDGAGPTPPPAGPVPMSVTMPGGPEPAGPLPPVAAVPAEPVAPPPLPPPPPGFAPAA